MKQLHPYWRMDYIEAPRDGDLARTFKELPAQGDDRAALIIYRSRLSYLVLNRYPYNPGHLLAVPFREVTDLEKLRPAERADLMETIVHGKRLLQAALKPDGFNVGFNLGSASGGRSGNSSPSISVSAGLGLAVGAAGSALVGARVAAGSFLRPVIMGRTRSWRLKMA